MIPNGSQNAPKDTPRTPDGTRKDPDPPTTPCPTPHHAMEGAILTPLGFQLASPKQHRSETVGLRNPFFAAETHAENMTVLGPSQTSQIELPLQREHRSRVGTGSPKVIKK